MGAVTGKRWTGVDAFEHIRLVEAGVLPRGLTYLSAYDYIGSPSRRTERPKKTADNRWLNAGYQ